MSWVEDFFREWNEVVTEYNGFKYNKNGRCLNPNKPIVYEGHNCGFEVQTAETPEGWVSGATVRFFMPFANGYNTNLHEDKQPTEELAIAEALKWIEKKYMVEMKNQEFRMKRHELLPDYDYSPGEIRPQTADKALKDFRRKLTEFKAGRQLTLF